MAVQNSICAAGAGLAVVHDTLWLGLVFYCKQSQNNFWRNGR